MLIRHHAHIHQPMQLSRPNPTHTSLLRSDHDNYLNPIDKNAKKRRNLPLFSYF